MTKTAYGRYKEKCISTHTSRVGCDRFETQRAWYWSYFYSHIPCGMWLIWPFIVFIIIYFYSHIPCGMWHQVKNLTTHFQYFYSHIPCGMWLVNVSVDVSTFSFLLTHPVWDVTYWLILAIITKLISTHTSRVGCDNMVFCLAKTQLKISTHTSRVGCDPAPKPSLPVSPLLFLLTHPVWDVT